MDGPNILRCLAALSRSRNKRRTRFVISMVGYQRIRGYGRTNGRTLDLPCSILGGLLIEVSG